VAVVAAGFVGGAASFSVFSDLSDFSALVGSCVGGAAGVCAALWPQHIVIAAQRRQRLDKVTRVFMVERSAAFGGSANTTWAME
jgi:hypothetical protein